MRPPAKHPLQNRVLPDGSIVAMDARGTMMGNRGGRFHDPETKTLLPRRPYVSKRWICCVTVFRNRHRHIMENSYTELFFLDEVTALSAGHRPCYECRRAAARSFAAAWQRAKTLPEPPKADAMDHVLHAERLAAPTAPPATMTPSETLPDGTIAATSEGHFFAKKGAEALWWSPDRYRRGALPAHIHPITPPAIRAVLAAGYQPIWHPSAD